MRLSDLLRAVVVDADGTVIGHVHDVRLVADGPPQGVWGPALRVHDLVVGRAGSGTRLGLTRPDVRGPALLKALFPRADHRLVRWQDVARIERRRIHLRAGAEPYAAGTGRHRGVRGRREG
jgi:hypothetical protein